MINDIPLYCIDNKKNQKLNVLQKYVFQHYDNFPVGTMAKAVATWYREHLIITFLWFPPTITSPNKTFWKKWGNNNTTTSSTGGQTVGFWWCWLLCRCVVMCLYEGRVRWPPHSQPQHPATIWDTSQHTTHHCLSSHQSSPSLADSLILEGCQATDISYNQV